jgi:hypothetical protein
MAGRPDGPLGPHARLIELRISRTLLELRLLLLAEQEMYRKPVRSSNDTAHPTIRRSLILGLPSALNLAIVMGMFSGNR